MRGPGHSSDPGAKQRPSHRGALSSQDPGTAAFLPWAQLGEASAHMADETRDTNQDMLGGEPRMGRAEAAPWRSR